MNKKVQKAGGHKPNSATTQKCYNRQQTSKQTETGLKKRIC
jgi:predicted alternative tryptophan synthase beta-subunit